MYIMENCDVLLTGYNISAWIKILSMESRLRDMNYQFSLKIARVLYYSGTYC
jgi:hypothetical protein